MSSGVVLSPSHAINKTRNAILRMKKCSPELKTVLRQRCQERIQNDRLKILNSFRKIKVQDSFRAAFGQILKEEWKSIEEESIDEFPEGPSTNLPADEFSLDEKLQLENLLEKELLLEHEDWLLQLYEELLNDAVEEPNEVVCPICCQGYLKQVKGRGTKKTYCSKCPANFTVEKSLLDLQGAIYECLALHDNQCNKTSCFLSLPKNENENNLSIVCHHCSYLNVIE